MKGFKEDLKFIFLDIDENPCCGFAWGIVAVIFAIILCGVLEKFVPLG